MTDPAGAVIPGAVLTARNTETGAQFETVTTATGNYTLSQLPAGVYEVGATASGFGKFLQQGIRVQVAQTARIDILLQVGATSESVMVSADAPLLRSLPFVFVTSFTYPTAQIGNNVLLRNLTGGWAIGGILRYRSGSPIQVPGAQNALASQLFRGTFANRVPGVPLFLKDLNCRCFDPNKEFVLNPAAWSDPAAGQWGTAAAYYNDYRPRGGPASS